MSVFRQDVQYALRGFAKRPGYTAVLVITLALGIGSNVAIFSVTNAVLFRPLPFENPDELVLIWNRLENTNVERALVSGPDFIDYQQNTTLFDDFAVAAATPGTLTGGGGRGEQLLVGWTSVNFLEVLGVNPMIGRHFEEEDAPPIDPASFADPNATFPPGALILSHGLWLRRFGSDPNVIGMSLQMDGQESIVVGVMPPGFRIYLPPDAGMPTDIDVWRAAPQNMITFADRTTPFFTVVSRLNPGVTVPQAQSEMDRLATTLREQHPLHARSGMHITVASMHEDIVAHMRPLLMALLVAAGFVLLIACANVANLLLVRAASREREIAVRAALGGGRGRIIRQMLTESGVLSLGGGALGVLLAWWGTRVLVAMRPDNLPRLEAVSIDLTVLGFTAGATVLAALLFGMAPALKSASPNLSDALRERGGGTGSGGAKIRTALVIAEVALSLVLLVGAGLMLRSFSKMRQVEPGFNPAGVLTFTVPLPLFKYTDFNVRADFYEEFQRRVEGLPAVQHVGGVAPLALAGGDQYLVYSVGTSDATEEEWSQTKADYKTVLPGYLSAMGARLVAGRFMNMSDHSADAARVVMIDEKLAARAWPGQEAVGRQLDVSVFVFSETGMSVARIPAEVIGVVGNIRAESLTEDGRETVYYPFRWMPFIPLSMTVRAGGDPLTLVPAIRAELEALDPEVPMADIQMMGDYITAAVAPTRFTFAIIGVFAGLALILASIGLYGVISYSVRQRTREIGVRIAFGASETTIMRLVLGRALALGLAGVGAGVVAAFLSTRTVSSLVYGVSTVDPVTFFGVPLILVVVTVAASYVPARRAMQVDPVEALREE